MSKKTKKYTFWSVVFWIFSFLCTVGPFSIYAIKGLIEADLIQEKVTLSMTVLIVLILSIIGWANKTVFKSRLWILLLGIYICLKTFMTPLIIIAVCQILDELLITPLYNYCNTRRIINKQMDARL